MHAMTKAETPLFDPSDFRIEPDICHVCAAGETAFLRRHDRALQAYARDKSAGVRGRLAQDAKVAQTRDLVARLWHVAARDIGFVSSVAEGMSMLAESMIWRQGDNICFVAHEYPSVAAPFAARRNPTVEVRLADDCNLDTMAALVDERTRLIAVSHVSYLSGARTDLAGLRRIADRVGAILAVDFSQASGYLPTHASVADFAFAACYKWLLGTTGIAIAYWNSQRQPEWAPTTAGWYSIDAGPRPDYRNSLKLKDDAMRFTRGNPAHAPLYVLAEALTYLGQFSMSDVEHHVQALTVELLRGLRSLGIPTMTPEDPSQHGASVCIQTEQAAGIVEALYDAGIYAWNGRGRVRFSFHGYNRMQDVERILSWLGREASTYLPGIAGGR
jgi:selenocysteine lyase/cysteine desulfurase